MNFKSRNLILIIDNGFDLAHGLKTSYSDFANYLIERIASTIINSSINSKYAKINSQALEIFNDYDVAIIGHSLGQTDKTLLKEVLDNDKCKRIHLFKRGDLKNDVEKVKNEFNKLKYSLSRIIEDERDLRNKVLNFEDSGFFPR